MDTVSKEKRSNMMAGIRSSNTKPEIIIRKVLHLSGFRFRLHKKIEGIRPDIVLPKWNTCIFVHGCYWHRHEGCRLASIPKSNVAFWREKFDQNVARDLRNINQLEAVGWKVGVIWECTTRSGLALNSISGLIKGLKSWEL